MLSRYDRVARLLHWLVAALVLVQFATGWSWGAFERGSPPRFYLFRTHLFAGYAVLALAVLRIGWRLTHAAPPLPDGMSRLTALAAHATHGLLYLAILVQPVLGAVTTTGFGKSLGTGRVHVALAYVIAASWRCTSRRRSGTISCGGTACCCACCRPGAEMRLLTGRYDMAPRPTPAPPAMRVSRSLPCLALGLALVLALGLALLAPPEAAAQPVPVEIAATPIERFDAGGAIRFGVLEFRGGLVLTSPSAEFGGLSGLTVESDGSGFVAVTDRGYWLTGRILSEGDRPTGIAEARLAPMQAQGGGTLAAKGRGDVESLVRTSAGYLVGIERRQEIWLFPGPDPVSAGGRQLIADPALSRLGNNEGPEAMLAPPGGDPAAVIVIAEESQDAPDRLPGFLFGPLARPAPTGRFAIVRTDEFNATDAALADDGTVYLLERRFDLLRGVALRLRRFPLAAIRPDALVEGEVLLSVNRLAAIDNMEGLALHRNAAGELILTLVSDDNFSALQRTLLLRFAVIE